MNDLMQEMDSAAQRRRSVYHAPILGHGGSVADIEKWRPPGAMMPMLSALADTTVNTGIRIGGTQPDEQKVEIAYVGFNTRLANRLKEYPSFFQDLATVVDSPNLIDRSIWLNNPPGLMRLWKGIKQISQTSAENLPIVTRPHEVSISIGKGTQMNDMLGLYSGLIAKMGEAYPNSLDDLVITMLCAGIQGTSLGATYDGQNLIDTDHVFRSADAGVAAFQYSNKVTGAFSAANYQIAVNLYKTLKNEHGVPVNVGGGPMMLVHGPANRILVRNVLKLDTASIGGFVLPQNLDKDTAIPVEVPWIQARTTRVLGTSVTLTGLEWFLMPKQSTAVILQRKSLSGLLSVEDGYQNFMTALNYYGMEAEFGAGYGLPQEIVGGPGS